MVFSVVLERYHVEREGVKPLFQNVFNCLGVLDMLSFTLPPLKCNCDCFFKILPLLSLNETP